MSESITSGGKKLRVDKPGGAPELVLWKHLLPVLRWMVRRMGGDLQIDGATSGRVGEDGNIVFKIKPAAADFPFKCPDTAGAHSVILSGSVNGVPVTGGTDLSIGDDDYVWVKATLTLSVSAQNYVRGLTTVTGYTYETGASLPSDTTTAAYKVIAKYTSGAKTDQFIINALTMNVKDDGTGTTTPNYIWI